MKLIHFEPPRSVRELQPPTWEFDATGRARPKCPASNPWDESIHCGYPANHNDDHYWIDFDLICGRRFYDADETWRVCIMPRAHFSSHRRLIPRNMRNDRLRRILRRLTRRIRR